jgi:hypothetical protein
MSTVTTGPVATEGTSGGPPPSWRRRGVAVAVVVLGVGLGAWWLATTPRLEGGGIASVSSADHEVVWASGLGEQVYVVPSDGPGSSTVAFGLRNDGPLPVELVDVWPNMDDPGCFWQPSERWFQDDPRHLGSLDDRARPAPGAVLAPGVAATVWVTGAHPDPGGCVHEALNTSMTWRSSRGSADGRPRRMCPWASRSATPTTPRWSATSTTSGFCDRGRLPQAPDRIRAVINPYCGESPDERRLPQEQQDYGRSSS